MQYVEEKITMKETEKITEKITERITERDASNNVDDEEDLKSYRKMRRQHLFDTRLNSSLQFDKQIIYVASGAIGLIFTLKSTIGIEISTLLITALIFLVVAIFANLVSYLTAIQSIDKDFVDNDKSADKWEIVTRSLNIVSLISITAGMLLLIIYLKIYA